MRRGNNGVYAKIVNGRAVSGGWHQELGVLRPGQDIKTLRAEKARAAALREEGDRLNKLESATTRAAQLRDAISGVYGPLPPHLEAIYRDLLRNTEDEIKRLTPA